ILPLLVWAGQVVCRPQPEQLGALPGAGAATPFGEIIRRANGGCKQIPGRSFFGPAMVWDGRQITESARDRPAEVFSSRTEQQAKGPGTTSHRAQRCMLFR